jgi:hypothetical protein
MLNEEKEARKKLVAAVDALSNKLLEVTRETDTPTTMLAAETLLAFRAAAAAMPLQDLMDNLLKNIPQMYAVGLQATLAAHEPKVIA